MVARPIERQVSKILSYVVASSDLFYSESNRRDIFIQSDDGTCFRVWAEIVELGEISAANLCEIFLEYSLTCQTMGDQPSRLACMQEFSEIFGQRLALYIKTRLCPPVERSDVPFCAMSCILDSMQVKFTVQESNTELSFVLERCPLQAAALKSGLSDIELAHYGVGVLCDSVMRSLDPSLSVHVPQAVGDEHVFIVNLPPNP